MKISAYTILFYDLQFYEDIIKHIYDYVDEIIVIDGPYSYAVDTLKKFNIFYDENNKPQEISNIIKKYPKIKYTYVICDNEEEKRMIGYDKCSNELILLADTDEFLNINMNSLNEFINNEEKKVGCLDIFNMCDYNINYNKIVQKYILFKKQYISSLEHLNYLWLIGCKQEEKKIEYMSFLPVGKIYHQTLNRNKKNNIIKFIFYTLLYRKNSNQEFNLLDEYNNDFLMSNLSMDEFFNVFIHSSIVKINIPSVSSENMLEINNDEFISNLEKYKNNYSDFYFLTEMKCLKNIPVCFRINNFKTISLFFENTQSINIKIYNIYLNSEYVIKNYEFKNILDDTIVIENNTNGNEIYVIIEINCHETINNDFIFKVKNIFYV